MTDAGSTELFGTIEQAIADIAAGRPVVVVDDPDRENEGDLVFAADRVTTELVAFTMTECRGLLCVPMEGEALDRLQLDAMVSHNTEKHGTAFTVSVDAREGISTGISAGTGHIPSGCWPTATRSRTIWSGPDTSFRYGPSQAACFDGPVTPRRRSTWLGWLGSLRSA